MAAPTYTHIVSEGKPDKKLTIFGIAAFLFLLSGLIVGLFLVRQRQNLKVPATGANCPVGCNSCGGATPVGPDEWCGCVNNQGQGYTNVGCRPGVGPTNQPEQCSANCQFCDCSGGGWSGDQCRTNCRIGLCTESAPQCGQKDYPSPNCADNNGGCPGTQCGAVNYEINKNCSTPGPTSGTTPSQQLCESISVIRNTTSVRATVTVNSASSDASAGIWCLTANGNVIDSTKVGSTSSTLVSSAAGKKIYDISLPLLTTCQYGMQVTGFALGPVAPGYHTTVNCAVALALSPTPIPLSSSTPIPLSTNTPIPQPSATPRPSNTPTNTPTPTVPPIGGANPTPTPTPSRTPTPTPSRTPTPTPSRTPTPTPSRTPTPTPTLLPTPTPTRIPTPTNTPMPGTTSTPTPAPTSPPLASTPNYCNGTCGSDANCQPGLTCYVGFCRLPSNPNDYNCNGIAPRPTATPAITTVTQIPRTGSSTLTVITIIGSIVLLGFGLLLAL